MHSMLINMVKVCSVFEWILLSHRPTLRRNNKLFSTNKRNSYACNIYEYIIIMQFLYG